MRTGIFAVGVALAMLGCSSSDTTASTGFGGGGGVGANDPNAGTGGDLENAGAAPGGATPGGAQDIGYARSIIEMGGVPPADSLTVEGLLSEHDIPTDGPPCTELLCIRPASAWAPSIQTGKNERWIQIGMTSGLGDFHRPPMDAVVLLDKSGAMGIDFAQTTDAVNAIVDKLRDDDRLAIVTFDDTTSTLRPLGPLGDRAALKAQVKALVASGGETMMPGLSTAFDVARGAGTDPTRMKRVMLLSCGYPDDLVHHGPSTFLDLVSAGATDHIGFSFYGVLLPFDYDLANVMSQARGGSYSYIEDVEKVRTLFDTDFDTMVTPIAYGLQMGMQLADPLSVDEIYGIPGATPGTKTASFIVQTAFISNKRGAIVARVKAPVGESSTAAGSVSLAYEAEQAVKAQPYSNTTVPIAEFDTSGASSFSGVGVRKAVFLVNQLEGMKQACTSYAAGDKAGAQSVLATLLAYMRSEQAAMMQPDLDAEIALVEKLAANVTK